MCEPVPREVCVDVKDAVTSLVPRQECNTVTRQRCETVQKAVTTSVPEQRCSDRSEEICDRVPRKKCDTVQDKFDRQVSFPFGSFFSTLGWSDLPPLPVGKLK